MSSEEPQNPDELQPDESIAGDAALDVGDLSEGELDALDVDMEADELDDSSGSEELSADSADDSDADASADDESQADDAAVAADADAESVSAEASADNDADDQSEDSESGGDDASEPASPASSAPTPTPAPITPAAPKVPASSSRSSLSSGGGFSSRSRGISTTPRIPISTSRNMPIPTQDTTPKKPNTRSMLAPAPRPEPPSEGNRQAQHLSAFRAKWRDDDQGVERDPNANYDDDPYGAKEPVVPEKTAAEIEAEAQAAAAAKAKAEAEVRAKVEAEAKAKAAAAEAKSKAEASFAVGAAPANDGTISKEMLDALGVDGQLKLADDRVYTEGGYGSSGGANRAGKSTEEMLAAARSGQLDSLSGTSASLPASGEPLRFGEAGIHLNIVNDAQVNEALAIQEAQAKRGESAQKIGQILLSRGSLDDDDIKRIINFQSIRDIAESIPGFKIVQKIGEGAMGAVYKAKQVRLDRWVAIKVLTPALAANQELRQRFIQEARVAARLNHPNIIGGIDAGDVGGLCYFAMEFVDGQTVSELVKMHGPMPIDASLRVVQQIAYALDHASQQGMIHRDIKPQNIMLTRPGVAKLLDLGLAKISAAVMRSNLEIPERAAVGTPNFISPEQARGDSDLDQRSDFYSLGVTLFYMLSGRTPFFGVPAEVLKKHISEPPPDLRTLRADLPEPVYHLAMRMMAKMKEVRPRTAALLAQEVDKVLALIGAGGGKSSPPPPPPAAVAPPAVVTQQPQQGAGIALPRKRRKLRPF